MYFCSFSSDSSGNSYLIKNENTAILLDAGISCKKILDGLKANDVFAEEVDAVLLTHEHSDHVKSVKTLAKKLPDAKFYLSQGTLDGIQWEPAEERYAIVERGQCFTIGTIKVRTFNLSHDANEPIGYSLEDEDGKVVVVTDTGCITEEIFDQMVSADLLVMEANHEVNILRMGDYPYQVKRRILSDHGHISNEDAGHWIGKVAHEREKKKPLNVLLAHMSKRNNTPRQAFLTIRNILEEEGLYIEKDLFIDVIVKDVISPKFEV